MVLVETGNPASARARGGIIELVGRVLRRDGTPVSNAAVEVWQANAAGKYRHPSDINTAPLDPDFQGYARLLSDVDGSFRVITVKPGAYPAPIGMRAPHVHFQVQSGIAGCRRKCVFPANRSMPLTHCCRRCPRGI